jgi:hypothetical protein
MPFEQSYSWSKGVESFTLIKNDGFIHLVPFVCLWDELLSSSNSLLPFELPSDADIQITDRQNVEKLTQNVKTWLKMPKNVEKMTQNVETMTENVKKWLKMSSSSDPFGQPGPSKS